MIYVTHDQVEAMTLADKIVVMNNGRVEQQGKPLDLYYRPANLFVAGFIGSPAMNFLAGIARPEGGVDLGAAGILAAEFPASVMAGDKLTLGIRPEHLKVTAGEGPGVAATVDLVERLGEMGFAHLRLPGGQVVIAEIRGETGLGPGGKASLAPEPSHIHVFDASGSRIG